MSRLDDLKKMAAKIVNDAPEDGMAGRVAARYEGKAPIEFPIEVVEQVFDESGDRCMCERENCDEGHEGRCPNEFDWKDRGNKDGDWQAHHVRAKSRGGRGTSDNCEIVCVECHKSTDNYGKP